jgi:hypothetical protein
MSDLSDLTPTTLKGSLLRRISRTAGYRPSRRTSRSGS